MKSPFGNMSNILKQAQAMQEQMAKVQEQAATKTVSGTAGGGNCNGNGQRRHGPAEREDRSGSRQGRGCRDAAGSGRGGWQRCIEEVTRNDG